MTHSLKVLHAVPVWLPQTQTWLHGQVEELQRAGTESHVVCERAENLEQFEVQNIHCLADEPLWQRTWDKGLRKLRVRRHLDFVVRTGRRVRTEVVHSHFGNVAWANLGAASALRAKHVVTFYGLDVNRLPVRFPVWRGRYRQLFDEVDRVLCEGSHMAAAVVRLGCPEDKVRVHHLGVALDQIPFRVRQWKPGTPLKVMVAASFREKKGIPDAIEALRLLQRNIDIELTIIGDAGPDPESQHEKARIVDALDRAGLWTRARLRGYQPHAVMMREAYGHHVFLHPSVTARDGDTEGGAPVSIIEMLATGMLVVSTTHCDIPEVMGLSLRHLLASEGDVEGLADRLRQLAAMHADWARLAQQGRAHVEAEYDGVRQAQRLAEHYRSLLQDD